MQHQHSCGTLESCIKIFSCMVQEFKEGPYQDRPPLCPFRLLPLLIYSGSAIAFLQFQGPKSKNIENVILLQP